MTSIEAQLETMVGVFGLEDQRLRLMGEIVPEIDVRDGRHAPPQTAGIDAVLTGWRSAGFANQELESHGVALFEGLYDDTDGPLALTCGEKRDDAWGMHTNE
jgi:hypothetical protein